VLFYHLDLVVIIEGETRHALSLRYVLIYHFNLVVIIEGETRHALSLRMYCFIVLFGRNHIGW